MLPIGRPVKLTLTSQDVIHDFSIPAFRIKQDVVPGMYTTEWFVPTQIGEYHLFCDQYCGAKHGEMAGTVVVCTEADYERWLAGDLTAEPPAVAGKKLFTLYGCNTCHGQYGPTLAGLYGRPVEVIDEHGIRRTVIADEAYLRESILYPSAKLVVGYPNRMPSFKSTLSEEQLLDLVQYIKSLTGAAETAPYKGPPSGAVDAAKRRRATRSKIPRSPITGRINELNTYGIHTLHPRILHNRDVSQHQAYRRFMATD